MKKIFLIFKLVLVFVFVFGCNKKKTYNNVSNNGFLFEIVDSIYLPVPHYASIERAPVLYYENDTVRDLYFLLANHDKKQIEFLVYDLKVSALKNEVVFPIEGENAFPFIHGVTIIAPDSIYATSITNTNFYLYDSTPRLLNTYSYEYNDGRQELSRVFSNIVTNRKVQVFDNRIHFSPSVHNHSLTNNQSLAFQVDLTENKVINLNFNYPDDYYFSEHFSHILSREFNGNEFIYAPIRSHDIWITDTNHKTRRTVEVKSDYFRQFSVNSDDDSKRLFNSVYNSSYGPFIYDKYRNLYYRFFYPGIDVAKNYEMLSIMSAYKPYFTIIVLDDSFERLAEIKMPKNTYDMNVFFVDKTGLNISINHYENPTLDEDFLRFHTLKLKSSE